MCFDNILYTVGFRRDNRVPLTLSALIVHSSKAIPTVFFLFLRGGCCMICYSARVVTRTVCCYCNGLLVVGAEIFQNIKVLAKKLVVVENSQNHFLNKTVLRLTTPLKVTLSHTKVYCLAPVLGVSLVCTFLVKSSTRLVYVSKNTSEHKNVWY